MKRAAIITALFAVSLFITGCGINDDYEYDHTPPAPPSGLYVYNGDQMAEITWNANRERDLAGYNVYYSYDNYKFERIGSTTNERFVDVEGVQNGKKYYYAVTAYDYDGNESDLSKDVVYSTPRPEGYNVTLDNSLVSSSMSGYYFPNTVVPFDDLRTDFFFTIDPNNGRAYLDIYEDTYIIDMGGTESLYEIEFAPDPELFPGELYAEAIPGHTYVIWTRDNHFAKIRVKSIVYNRMIFDWTFQTIQGEPMLKRGSKERSSLNIDAKSKSLKERGIEIHK